MGLHPESNDCGAVSTGYRTLKIRLQVLIRVRGLRLLRRLRLFRRAGQHLRATQHLLDIWQQDIGSREPHDSTVGVTRIASGRPCDEVM